MRFRAAAPMEIEGGQSAELRVNESHLACVNGTAKFKNRRRGTFFGDEFMLEPLNGTQEMPKDSRGRPLEANWGPMGKNGTLHVIDVLEAIDAHKDHARAISKQELEEAERIDLSAYQKLTVDDCVLALEYLARGTEHDGIFIIFNHLEELLEGKKISEIPKRAYYLAVQAYESKGKYKLAKSVLDRMMTSYPNERGLNFSALQLDLPETKKKMVHELSHYLRRNLTLDNDEDLVPPKEIVVCNTLPGLKVDNKLPDDMFRFQVQLAHTCHIFPQVIHPDHGVPFEALMRAAVNEPPHIARSCIAENVNNLVMLYRLLTVNITAEWRSAPPPMRKALPFNATVECGATCTPISERHSYSPPPSPQSRALAGGPSGGDDESESAAPQAFEGTRSQWFEYLSESVSEPAARPCPRGGGGENNGREGPSGRAGEARNPHVAAMRVLARAFGLDPRTSILQAVSTLRCKLVAGGFVECERHSQNAYWLGRTARELQFYRRLYRETPDMIATRLVRLEPVFVRRNRSADERSPLYTLLEDHSMPAMAAPDPVPTGGDPPVSIPSQPFGPVEVDDGGEEHDPSIIRESGRDHERSFDNSAGPPARAGRNVGGTAGASGRVPSGALPGTQPGEGGSSKEPSKGAASDSEDGESTKRRALQQLDSSETDPEYMRSPSWIPDGNISSSDLEDVSDGGVKQGRPHGSHTLTQGMAAVQNHTFKAVKGFSELGIVPSEQITIRLSDQGNMEMHDINYWKRIERIPIPEQPRRSDGVTTSVRRLYLVGFFENCRKGFQVLNEEKGKGSKLTNMESGQKAPLNDDGDQMLDDLASFPQRIGFDWTSLHSFVIAEQDGLCKLLESSTESLRWAIRKRFGESAIKEWKDGAQRLVEFQKKFPEDSNPSFPTGLISDYIQSHIAFKGLQYSASGRDPALDEWFGDREEGSSAKPKMSKKLVPINERTLLLIWQYDV